MRSCIILIFNLFISIYSAVAQDFISIQGRIQDVETKESIAFATVNILHTPLGVVSNSEGEFKFSFPKKHLTDSIIFSSAGFSSERYLIQQLVDQPILIELAQKAVLLSEVVVTDKELTAWEVLELGLKNIKNNYPTSAFEVESFYRDYKLENEQCVGLYEAAISVYDKGYSYVPNKFTFKEKVVLQQVRKSLNATYQTHIFNRFNVMKELLKLNDVRYQTRALDKKSKRGFVYTFDGYEVINDRLMHKIKAKAEWTYYFYVDVVNYAIPRIEMDFKWEDVVSENDWVVGDTLQYKQTNSTFLLDFQLIDKLYYPKYSCFTADLEAYDLATKQLLFTSYLRQEYMVTNINFDPDNKPEKENQMNPFLMVEQQKYEYNPEFWKNYNILQLHPRDKELIKGLEEKMELEKQFNLSKKKEVK